MTVSPLKSKMISLLAHVLVWMVFAIAIFFYHPLFSDIEIPAEAWITQTITLTLLIAAFYTNTRLLVPRLLLNNRFVAYFMSTALLVIIVAFINRGAENAVYHSSFAPHNSSAASTRDAKAAPHFNFGPRRLIDRPTIIICILVLGIGTSLTAIQKWQKDKQERETLEKEKLISELSFLKAQINPHFFFNTLNNIYALTQVNADEAGKAVYQLSRMMRYLLYETQQGQTMLSREIDFLKDYISLMQLRLTDATIVTVNMPDHLSDLPMAPMMLLPFVENAFKHGVSATQPGFVDLLITQDGSALDMTVRNSIMKDNSTSLDTNSGIGLVNTRRRLDLLYPGRYTLSISAKTTDHEYVVHLILDLT